jgi:NPCBM/NEW2 domain
MKKPIPQHQQQFNATKLLAVSLALTMALIACNTTPPAKNPYTTSISKTWTQDINPQNVPPLVNGFLSDQKPIAATSGYGPIELKRSNGSDAANDGGPITIGGQQYADGLGVHATSAIKYKLDPSNSCTMFKAEVGLDDEIRTQSDFGSVTFEVWVDEVKVWESEVLKVTGTGILRKVDVALSGKSSLELRVTNAGDEDAHANWYDHADWADARVECAGTSTPPTSPATQVLSTGFVSDQMNVSFNQQNGWGPIEVNMANGDDQPQATTDSPYYNGHEPPLTLKTGVVSKGLGVHAGSGIQFPIGGQCSSFSALVGLDQAYLDKAGHTVNFQVLVDEKVKGESGVMNKDSDPVKIVADLTGGKTLKLVVMDGGDGKAFDHADWGNARVECGGVSTPPVTPPVNPPVEPPVVNPPVVNPPVIDPPVVRTFEAQGSGLSHSIGRADGDSWLVSSAVDNPGYAVYGPYVTDIKSGVRTATFRMASNTFKELCYEESKDFVILEIFDATRKVSLSKRNVSRCEFYVKEQADGYGNFILDFVNDYPGNQLEFRVYWTGISFVKVGRISIY